MNHEFDNDFEQSTLRDKGRSRRKGTGSAGRTPKKTTEKSRQNGRRRRRIITLILAECFALCFMFGYRYVKHKASLFQVDDSVDMKQMTNPNISIEKEESMKGYWTIALFGVDSRNNSVGKGNNADVIIICNINQENGEIKLTSVFRDSYLNIDDKSSYNKINQSYFLGGPKQAVEALNRNLDLEIDDYATFNWKAVADAINILGGVDVELSKAEFYYINAYITETVKATNVGSHQLKQAGMNHLDGVQAVAYARLRKMDTDFARTERQRKVIQLSFEKLKKANFAVVNNVMEVVFPQILTSVTLNDVIPAAKNLTKYTIADTSGFPSARSDANMGKKGDCVIPQTLESNVVALHQFLFGDENYQPSDMVKKISAKISADTGMYKEGKAIDSVGTDGGYIPKETQAPQETKESAAENGESSSNGETKESIIDGETILETDEFGMPIDPPEDYDYGTGTLRPSGSASESSVQEPGGNVSPGGSNTSPGGSLTPGGSTAPTGGNTSPSHSTLSPATEGETRGDRDSVTGPGATTAAETVVSHPGATTAAETQNEGPGSVIIGPGV